MIYVDVKTFLSFRIETDDLKVAEAEAKRFLEALNASPDFIDGWNDVQRKEGGPIIAHVGNFDTEEPAYFEDEDGNEVEL